jgi:hypothetical protein
MARMWNVFGAQTIGPGLKRTHWPFYTTAEYLLQPPGRPSGRILIQNLPTSAFDTV